MVKVCKNQVATLTHTAVYGCCNYSLFKTNSHKDGDDKKILKTLGNCLENMTAQRQLVSLALSLVQL